METKFKQGSEEFSMLMEYYHSIPFLKWMASGPEVRGYAKDRERDKKGRIIVDVTKPHILEDMDYFRPAALYYMKHKKFTEAYPSRNPASPFRKFWDEEIRRCEQGYVRESDGEWIPGYFYFYLNYSPIMRTVIVGERTKDGSVRAERKEGFPDVWDGDYMFFHYLEQAEKQGKYSAVLKRRGSGYSFKNASMLNRNYFIFKKSVSYAVASDTAYLDTDGILNKADDQYSFVNKHVGFAKKLALKDTLYHRKSGYKKLGESAEYGFKSERIGITLNNNPHRIRGKRGKLIVWEEGGSFNNLIVSWRIAQNSMEDGKRVFGLMCSFGTGGEVGAGFMGLEQMFYNPKSFRILELNNVWDKNVENATCAIFVPAYMNRADCYDENGNSDVIKALEEVLEMRLEVMRTSTDTNDVAQVKAEQPVTPRDAVMKIQGTVFPVKELSDVLADVEPTREEFVSHHYIITLLRTSKNSVTWRPEFETVPIRDFPFDGLNTQGAIEVFSLPKTGSNGEVPYNRYILGVDSIDDDIIVTGKRSFFAIVVFDLWTDTIAAQWIGRYARASDNFYLALNLAIFYNGQINYENKNKGIYSYMDKHNMLRYLMPTPEILKEMEYVKAESLVGNRSYGTPPTKQINAWARNEQADWMLQPNEFHDNVLNYKLIRSIRYLWEAYQWNIDGNFDIVSAMNMVFIARADKYKFIEASKNSENEKDDWEDDEFLNLNDHSGNMHDLVF